MSFTEDAKAICEAMLLFLRDEEEMGFLERYDALNLIRCKVENLKCSTEEENELVKRAKAK